MDNSTRISELAAIITSSTSKIDSHLLSKGLPTPSFDTDAPSHLLFDKEILSCRQVILEATDELNALMRGPIAMLMPSMVCNNCVERPC